MRERAERCDLCSGVLEEGATAYVYVTPSTGTLEEAEHGEAFWCEDPYWAACPTCHEIVQAHDRGETIVEQAITAVIHRSLNNQRMVVLGPMSESLREQMEAEQQAFIMHVVTAFFHHRSPGFEVETPEYPPRRGF